MRMISPRSPETEQKYQAFKKAKRAVNTDLTVFDLTEEIIVREFDHWLIIENRFPYDNMTSVNHMLVPRRSFDDYYAAEDTERDEYHEIIKQLAAENYYDAIVENLPRSKSVSRHNHIHLVRWKYTTEDGRNKSDAMVNDTAA